jgi:hypothetical protein
MSEKKKKTEHSKKMNTCGDISNYRKVPKSPESRRTVKAGIYLRQIYLQAKIAEIH